MRRFLEVFLVGVFCLPLLSANVSAYTLSKSGKITISGVVEARTYIVVDNTDKIIKIYANDFRPAKTVVSRNTVTNPEIPMAQKVSDQYMVLLPTLKFRPAVIYESKGPKSITAAEPLKKSHGIFNFGGMINPRVLF